MPGLFIRGEGLIPQSPLRGITSGRIFSVLNPRPIPYKNNIPRPFRAGLLILASSSIYGAYFALLPLPLIFLFLF